MGNEKASQEVIFSMPKGFIAKIKYIISAVGPGGIIAVAAMGPGTIASCLTAGATFGYSLTWFVIICGIMAAVLTTAGGKITAATGKTAFDLFKEHIGIWAVALVSIHMCVWYLVIMIEGTVLYEVTATFLSPWTTGYNYYDIIVVIQVILMAWVFTQGYGNIVKIASFLTVGLVIVFTLNILYIRPNIKDIIKGLVPMLPSGAGRIAFAGLLGGSANGFLALCYSFNTKDKGWDTPSAFPFMCWDQGFYMGLIFNVFSIAIYVSAAAILHPAGIEVTSAINAAKSLEPLVGPLAKWIFLVGLWGSTFGIIGGMSMMGAYCISALLKYKPSLSEKKVKIIIAIGCLISCIGCLAKNLKALPLVVLGMALLTLTGPIYVGLFMYYGNNKKIMGENKYGLIHNISLAFVFLANLYAAFLTISNILAFFA